MGFFLSYYLELCHAMEMLAERPATIFMGQGVAVPGTTMSSTLANIPKEKLLEMPVAEELQMGMANGIALMGYLPICIFPRMNFMLRAGDQIVTHLDRLPIYSNGGYCPKVIIRTAVPSTDPFYPGAQHDDDFTSAFAQMFRTIIIVKLTGAGEIVPEYRRAMNRAEPTMLVEFTEYYRDERGKAAA
jgi:pyruvate/2-oxoglutarate/acetoin dehydrogenase E1 component